MEKVLLTGGMGFIGAHVTQYILEKTDWDIVILDRLDFSGTISRLEEVIRPEDEKRVRFVHWDLKAELNDFVKADIGDVDYIIHLAANSSVDRTIADPLGAMMDNAIGTTNLLNFARTLPNLKKMINFSTDESTGPAPVGVNHTEDAPHRPSNPYAAAKAAQEDIGYAFFVTYGLPVITTRTMNNFSILQHPEKLIPKTIRSVINGEPMPIFSKLNDKGELENVGSRFWLNCRDTASAILFLLDKGVPGEFYNIIGFEEFTNLEVAQKVADIIGKPLIAEMVDFHKTRKGHDRRYALDGSKMRDMGWKPELSFDEALKGVVEWYLDEKNKKWLLSSK
jgi:dTDP-glucose 4,6-dehydratase